MQHALVDIAASIQHWAAKSNHQPFRDAAAEWVAAIDEQVTGDLQAVECLERLDQKTDAIAQAKHSLCAVMGIDPKTDMAEVLKTAEITFRSFLQLEVAK